MNSLLIAGNIVTRVFKNPKEALTLLLLPVLLIGIISYAIGATTNGSTADHGVTAGNGVTASNSGTSAQITFGLINLDQGGFSGRFADYLKSQKDLKLVLLSEQNYLDQVKNKKVTFAVVVPSGFSAGIARSQKVEIGFYSNALEGDSQSMRRKLNQFIAALYSANETAARAAKLAGKNGRDQEQILDTLMEHAGVETLSMEYRVAVRNSNKTLNPGVFSAIGFTVIFMMVLIFTTIGTLMDDKKKLTLARMYVSPLQEWEIITGNLLGSLILGTIQLIPLMVTLKYIFELNSVTTIIGITVTLFCFLVATVGLGIGLSGVIKKSFNPLTMIATVITPSGILGGCFIPDSMLPDLMNKIGYIVPQKWVMQAILKLLSGAGLEAITLHLVIILMFGLAFTTFGLKTIRPLND